MVTKTKGKQLLERSIIDNELEYDGIVKGDRLIIDPNQQEVENGKLYLIELDGKSVIRRLYHDGDEIASMTGIFENYTHGHPVVKGRVVTSIRVTERQITMLGPEKTGSHRQ
jgi:hypothetical protein